MNGEILRLEIGIRRSHSNSSPARTPLQAGDGRYCAVARTFSCPRLGWVPERQKPVQNRMKVMSREGFLGLLTTASIVGTSLHLPWTCTGLVVLARHHALCLSLTIHQPASSRALSQPSYCWNGSIK